MPGAKETENRIRELFRFRMSLLPYLYNAFADYHFKGIPPFRALIVDYPDNQEVFNLADEYMIGPSLLAAPLTGKSDERKIYLPTGNWYRFHDGKKFMGDSTYVMSFTLDQLPLFVREGTILPLAEPVQHVDAKTTFLITCRVYGSNASGSLFGDDGVSYDFEKGMFNRLDLTSVNGKHQLKWTGSMKRKRYQVVKWEQVR